MADERVHAHDEADCDRDHAPAAATEMSSDETDHAAAHDADDRATAAAATVAALAAPVPLPSVAAGPPPPRPPPAPSAPEYFEHQRLARCAMHTLNNLLQSPAWDALRLNALCRDLSPGQWINPHKSMWGLGNWDVNVLMRALSLHGLSLRWFDRRKPLESIELESASLYALILNVPSASLGTLGARHWFCVKKFASGDWWRMDSNAPANKQTWLGPKLRPIDKAERIDDVRTEHALASNKVIQQFARKLTSRRHLCDPPSFSSH